MTKDRGADLAALLKAVVPEIDASVEDEPEPEMAVSEFAVRLAAALGDAIAVMRRNGMLEVEEASMNGLVEEVVEAGLDTKSPKQLVSRVIRTLLESDQVEEIYGTDEEIGSALRTLLGEG